MRYWEAGAEACYKRKDWLQLTIEHCREAQQYMRVEKEDQRLKMETTMKTHDQEIMKYFYLGSLM
jgi:hypothetical protein